jgi:hypothetical protein
MARFYSSSILILIIMISTACVPTSTPEAPTRTPRPTITSTLAATPAATEILSPTEIASSTPAPSATAGESSATLTLTLTLTATASLEPSATPTRRPIARATLAPLTITNILLIKVERDETRINGAIASLQIVYSGGRAPYRIFHDDTLQPENPFQVLTVCHGTIVHTVRVTSGDKQTVTKKYYLSPIDCPP